MLETGIEAGAVGVIHQDGVVTVCRGFEAGGAPISASTRHWLSGTSKTYTAALVARMAHDKRLSLDHRTSTGETVEQLVTHTAGLADCAGPGCSLCLARTRHVAAETHPLSCPEGLYSYSNASYVRLGSFLETETGTPFAELLVEEVLDPCGLSRTRLEADDRPEFAAATGLASTLDDQVTYLQLLATASGLAAGGTVDGAWVPALLEPRRHAAAAFEVALGWYVRQLGGHTIIQHGGAGAHHSLLVLAPSLELAIAVLVPAPTGGLPKILLAERLLERLGGLAPDPPPSLPEPEGLHVDGRYVGGFDAFTLERCAGGIKLRRPGGGAVDVMFHDRRTFSEVTGPAAQLPPAYAAELVCGEDGSVVGVIAESRYLRREAVE
jgi:CubicO group peptidase (beta-lactamase class C family)